MKFFLAVALVCAIIGCINASYSKVYGDVHEGKFIDRESVFSPPDNRHGVVYKKFTFPKVIILL